MDRVQPWRVLGGQLDQLPAILEETLQSEIAMRRVWWDQEGDRLRARTRWGPLIGRQTLTVRVAARSAEFWDLEVGSSTLQLLDWGANRRNLDKLRDATTRVGFTVNPGPIRTSWHRSTRP